MARGTKPNTRGPWLKDARLPRQEETIGGGFFVFRRGDDTRRIRPSQWPFEHGSQAAAEKQAALLAMSQPGYLFEVVKVVSGFYSGSSEPHASIGPTHRVEPASDAA